MPSFAYFCGHEQFQPEILLEHAVQAEVVGFDALTVSDHFHPWVDDASAAGFAWTEVGADIVVLQVTSVDQAATLKVLGAEILPALRRLAPSS